jgi:hypothetical protein
MNTLKTTALLLLSMTSFSQVKAQLTLSASKMELCVGTTSTISAQDSTATAFVWSPDSSLSSDSGTSVIAFPTDTTTYTVVSHDSAGPVDTAMITITVNFPPQITSNGPLKRACIEDTVTLKAWGAQEFTWSGPTNYISSDTGREVIFNPGTTSEPRTYDIIGYNGSCSDSASIEVRVDTTLPELNIATESYDVCQGSSREITATGATSYEWSDPTNTLDTTSGFVVNASPTDLNQGATYTVTGYIGACKSTESITLQAVPLAQFSFTRSSGGQPLCLYASDTISFSGNTSNYAIKHPQGTHYTSTNQSVLTAVESSMIYLTAKTDAGCAAKDSFMLVVDTTCVDSSYLQTGLEKTNKTVEVSIFAQNKNVVIASDKLLQNSTATVYDLSGKKVAQRNIRANRTVLPIDNSTSGIYIVTLQTERKLFREKIFIR